MLRGAAPLAVAAAVLALGATGAGAAPASKPTVESRYLTMRDGVRIAIDLWLPGSRRGRIPTLLRATRYWRSLAYEQPGHPDTNADEAAAVTGAGYALVLVDVRGSGASFGRWTSPWSRPEIDDLGEVVDWIVRQSWSNGLVGAYGASYDGNTAEFLASLGRPAVRAIVPISPDFDPYSQNAYPGGIFSDWFVHVWNLGNQALDRNDICALAGAVGKQCVAFMRRFGTGVKPVDRRLLPAAIRAHAANVDVYAAGRRLVFRDDEFAGTTMATWSPYTYVDRLARAGVAVQTWVGWLDAGTVDGALSRFGTVGSSQTVVIGPWSHAARYDADPFDPPDAPVQPTAAEQVATQLHFFDAYLKGTSPPPLKREIRYYTMDGGGWHTTSVWPPRGLSTQRWFFGSGHQLTGAAPTSATGGVDRMRVDFTATSGPSNRWHTQAGDDVVYPDRAQEDAKLLTYTSPALTRPLEITGNPVVTLEVTSTATDGAFIVYLEDVGPTGRVTYLTEGELRARDRRISTKPPPYRVHGPYHSFLRADAEPLVPGQVAELSFALLPTSVLIRKGHRLRVAVAGADQGTFARIPAVGTPTVAILHTTLRASRIDLPVRAG